MQIINNLICTQFVEQNDTLIMIKNMLTNSDLHVDFILWYYFNFHKSMFEIFDDPKLSGGFTYARVYNMLELFISTNKLNYIRISPNFMFLEILNLKEFKHMIKFKNNGIMNLERNLKIYGFSKYEMDKKINSILFNDHIIYINSSMINSIFNENIIFEQKDILDQNNNILVKNVADIKLKNTENYILSSCFVEKRIEHIRMKIMTNNTLTPRSKILPKLKYLLFNHELYKDNILNYYDVSINEHFFDYKLKINILIHIYFILYICFNNKLISYLHFINELNNILAQNFKLNTIFYHLGSKKLNPQYINGMFQSLISNQFLIKLDTCIYYLIDAISQTLLNNDKIDFSLEFYNRFTIFSINLYKLIFYNKYNINLDYNNEKSYFEFISKTNDSKINITENFLKKVSFLLNINGIDNHLKILPNTYFHEFNTCNSKSDMELFLDDMNFLETYDQFLKSDLNVQIPLSDSEINEFKTLTELSNDEITELLKSI